MEHGAETLVELFTEAFAAGRHIKLDGDSYTISDVPLTGEATPAEALAWAAIRDAANLAARLAARERRVNDMRDRLIAKASTDGSAHTLALMIASATDVPNPVALTAVQAIAAKVAAITARAVVIVADPEINYIDPAAWEI